VARKQAPPRFGPPDQSAARCVAQGGWCARRGIRLGRPKARPRPSTGVEDKKHGLPRRSDLLWATTRAARLASGQVQSTWWYARATAVRKHVQPHHVRSARPSGIQRGSTRRRDGIQTFPTKQFTARRPASSRDSSHDDGELKGMSGPEARTRRRAAVLRLDGQHTGK
jgi:hypothetical protein